MTTWLKILKRVKAFKHRPYWTCSQLIVLSLGLAGFLLFLCFMGILGLQIFYVTTPVRYGEMAPPPELDPQDVTLMTGDGLRISAWYVPGTRPEGIILVHGIHANRAYLIPQAVILAEAGYHLLLLDLRGHGRSEGRELTYGYREALDVQAATDYLLALPEVDRVGALGHSLGAAAVVRAAATDERLQALVIQSSYSSLPQATTDAFNNFSIFPRWPFAPLIIALAEYRLDLQMGQIDSARDLATMKPRPVLIIHSTGDPLFRPHHAQRMYEAAQEPKALWLVDGVGHLNPIEGHEAAYRERLLSFFEQALSPP